MSVETAQVPAWMKTNEYKAIRARYEKLADKGEIALLELTPAARNERGNPIAFGGFSVMGKIRDNYKNIVLDTANIEDRIGIGPMGVSLRFNEEDNLRFIYAIMNCPVLRNKCVLKGETPIKHQHRFVITDAEHESSEYATKREEAIKYQNKFYAMPEETINLLCTIAAIPVTASLGVKRADLCQIWESDSVKKAKIKAMMDSPDIDYYQTAHLALKEGEATAAENKGFYKTQNGVYKHNDQILGNSIENVIAYLKQNEELFFALKKSNEKPGAVAKPK
jgi:hypothetical protein